VSTALRSLFGVALAVAVAAPLFRDTEQDSYPFSTYPMFARVLSKPRLTYAEGIAESGKKTRLPPSMIGSDEPMQAMRTLKLAANGGRRGLKRLCRAIAERVAKDRGYADLRQVRVARAQFDPVAYFEVGPSPEDEESLVQCPVRR
jgi:hypothetical protein